MPEFEPPVLETPLAGVETPLVSHRRPRGILVVVALLVAAAVAMHGRPGGQEETTPRPSPSPTRPRPTPTPAPTYEGSVKFALADPATVLDLPGRIYAVDFGPGGSALALAEECTVTDCRYTLAGTRDGRHWSRRRLPPGLTNLSPETPPQRVIALGPETFLVDSHTRKRWHTADGGRTWRRIEPELRDPVQDTAGNGRLVLLDRNRAPSTSPCSRGEVLVMQPGSGQTAPLAYVPDVDPCFVTPYPDQTGKLWIAGLTQDHQPAVALSGDGGRGWALTVLPEPGLPIITRVSVVLSGGIAYVVVEGRIEENPQANLLAIHRNAGGAWQEVWRWRGAEPESISGPLVVAGDGVLRLHNWRRASPADPRRRWMESRDTGRTWGWLAGTTSLRVHDQTPAGWLGTRLDSGDPNRYVLSPDGVTWRELGVW